MEKIAYKYQHLFSIEIWHDYFLNFYRSNDAKKLWNQLPPSYAIRDFLEVRASGKTERTFRNFGLKFHPTPKGVSVYAQVMPLPSGVFKTQIPLDNNIQFTFEFFAPNPDFFNYSNIPIDMAPRNIFYFNNLETNKTDDGNYISRALDVYSDSMDYSVGDLVVNAQGNTVYESIADRSVKGDLENQNKWMGFEYKNDPTDSVTVNGVQVVSSKDILAKQIERFVYEEKNENPGVQLKFELEDVFGNVVNLGNIPGTSIPQNEIQAPADSNIPIRHTISLDQLPNGRYTLKTSTDGAVSITNFYLFQSRQQRSPIGIIDLFSHSPHSEYQFFEPRLIDGKAETIIRPKTYKIRFKNRSTQWRYYKNGDTSVPPQRTVIQPLTNNYVKLSDNLPNPEADRITLSRNTASNEIEAIYSDIYLYDIKI